MKKQFSVSHLFALLFLFVSLGAFAQKKEAYEFKEIKRLNATPVKSQDQTGTCWAFSSASFVESEALRMGKGQQDLSEMFVVRNIYRQKCENYVRRQGKANFGEGGLAHDLFHAVETYGIVPESIYPGRKDPSRPFNHSRLERDLKQQCDEFIEAGKAGKLQPDWMSVIDRMLDEEFGPAPIKFTYNDAVFSPTSYRDYLGFHSDNYITITSFNHHPFWSSFILEIPDNFSNGSFYNVPLNEMMRCLNYALQQGFTVEWDADVSNQGFSAQNGIAIVPETTWDTKTADQKSSTFKYWEPEQTVSQDLRQQLFDTQVTTDDHLMHIVGALDEAHDGNYYLVKNSWGEISDLKGFVRVSESYMRLNTISITLHKDAIPLDIRQRLGLVPDQNSMGRNRRLEMETPRSEEQVPRVDKRAMPPKGQSIQKESKN